MYNVAADGHAKADCDNAVCTDATIFGGIPRRRKVRLDRLSFLAFCNFKLKGCMPLPSLFRKKSQVQEKTVLSHSCDPGSNTHFFAKLFITPNDHLRFLNRKSINLLSFGDSRKFSASVRVALMKRDEWKAK